MFPDDRYIASPGEIAERKAWEAEVTQGELLTAERAVALARKQDLDARVAAERAKHDLADAEQHLSRLHLRRLDRQRRKLAEDADRLIGLKR